MTAERIHKALHGDSGDKMGKKKVTKAKTPEQKPADDFISVARRLGADEDKATFEAKLAKIAKATQKAR